MADVTPSSLLPLRAPTGSDDRLQWLVDRAEIGDLLLTFARCLDKRGWAVYTALYVPGSRLQVGSGFTLEGRDVVLVGTTTALSDFRGRGTRPRTTATCWPAGHRPAAGSSVPGHGQRLCDANGRDHAVPTAVHTHPKLAGLWKIADRSFQRPARRISRTPPL